MANISIDQIFRNCGISGILYHTGTTAHFIIHHTMCYMCYTNIIKFRTNKSDALIHVHIRIHITENANLHFRCEIKAKQAKKSFPAQSCNPFVVEN